jgi:hypothetical protein
MATRARLFVSGGPDQEPAREMLGRVLAEIPANVGWIIKRTPDVDSAAESHLHILLFGADIWAPVGLELWWAQRTETPILAYHADLRRTPAGQVFYQEHVWLGWKRFGDLSHLRRLLLADLSRFLVSHAERYGLTLIEIELLRGFLSKLDAPDSSAIPGQATGAAGGGVILAPGKDEPPGARLVGEE